ncbi:MAG: pyruvate formate lyase family protein [Dehalococcoidia bacterium]
MVQTLNEQAHGFLNVVAQSFNSNPALQNEIKGTGGWIDAVVGIKSEDGQLEQAIVVKDGTINIEDKIPANVNVSIIFSKGSDVLEQLQASPDEAYKRILRGMVRTEGNTAYMGFWDYLVSNLLSEGHHKAVNAQIEEHRQANLLLATNVRPSTRIEYQRKKDTRLKASNMDSGVKYLDDPYLSEYSINHFPRLVQFRKERLNARPEVCAEYGKLMTDFFVKHGYETKSNGQPWEPNTRCAESFKYLMEHREPVIRKNDLIAGSYTPNPVWGIVSQPNVLGPFFWGELRSCSDRELDPYDITEDTIQTLHKYVFPYWADRNTIHWWKKEFDNPLGSKIHDRYFSLSFFKVIDNGVASPGYKKVLQKGLSGLKAQIDDELKRDASADQEKKSTLAAMKISLDAVSAYTKNLAELAAKEAQTATNPTRKAELEHIHRTLQHVPEHPARTLDEAVQALMIMHIAVGLEIVDDGPSLGRLDQILQPYFVKDIEKLASKNTQDEYIQHAIELIGCLFLRVNSHWPLVPGLGTWMNSGSPFNTTIVVGGVTPQGEDAVNDMSYIILKVTEMLTMNDPNMHARYHSEKNSRTFLERLCEVNYITGATPAIHGDEAMITAWSAHGDLPIEDIRDWTPTGCVEPSIPEKQYPCTSSGAVNLVALFEMAMNNGTHPLMKWDLGPKTGKIADGAFQTFEDFFDAFKKQSDFMCGQLVEGDIQLGELYCRHYPETLMSTLYDGCIENGRNVSRGGARYNSSGVSIIGLTNVVDSLMAIKKLVYDEKRIKFAELKKAIDNNFAGYEKLHAMVKNNVPRFGSGNPKAVAMANRVTKMVSDFFRNKKDSRGGHYATGWWSMNRHGVYGRVTGALPSGRLDGEPFTPGLTPSPDASPNLLDNLLDVAQLDPKSLDNNIAFNVRIVPSSKDTLEQTVKHMADYVETYISKGGMQVQFNVVSTETLKDAMAHPEHYADLMVRISGYCGYFTQLQRDLQLEIIRRSEYGL